MACCSASKELERFFPLNLANDWYGFSYPVDWDGDGRVDVIDVIHAETNYARVPDGPHGLSTLLQCTAVEITMEMSEA